jgi:hypothetical protein
MPRLPQLCLSLLAGAGLWLPLRSAPQLVEDEPFETEQFPGDPPGIVVRDYLRDWDRGAGAMCWERMDADSRADLDALARPTGRSGIELASMLSVVAAGRRAMRPGDDCRRVVAVVYDQFRSAAVTLESPGGRRATIRLTHDGDGWRVPVWIAGVTRDRRAVGRDYWTP